ncbi:serine hydrolase domain-containing protein [Actinomycetaceae bacterium MB13-C1-2]|nr:serine hydrolase domain-containing protein [Actinomycetaceae bacterium MB13-C1-2]
MNGRADEYPVPFRHAIAAVDGSGRVLWSQGELDRVFPLASVTKVLTSLGTMRAVEEGLVSLDTPIGRRTGHDEPYTVRHLLSHSSGLDVEGDGDSFRDAPEQKRIYSNQGFEVLGRHLEKSVGAPLEEWMRSRVYEPLGLQATEIPGSPARAGVGTAEDLTLLVEEFLDPQLFAPETLAVMTSVAYPGLRGTLPGYGLQPDNAWGLGLEIKGNKVPHWTPPGTSAKTFGHFGVSGSYLWVDPEQRIGAVFLGEEPFGKWHKENWPKLARFFNQIGE